jgi:hypothetical protein
LDDTVFESRALSSGATLFALFAIRLDFLGLFGRAFLKRLAAESAGSRAVADLLAVFNMFSFGYASAATGLRAVGLHLQLSI